MPGKPAMLTVAIIGAGPLGRWLAFAAARAGFRVLLEDVMPANLHHAQEMIRSQLGPLASDTLEKQDFNTDSEASKMDSPAGVEEVPAIGNPPLAYVSTIEDAVRDADLVIDCVPDELESKLEILWLLDRMAPPRTVLATPTTHLSIADLAACTYRPDKCVAIAVEPRDLTAREPDGETRRGREILLRSTAQTSAETLALVLGFWQRLGFTSRFEADSAA